jgi:hypothetical protein
MNDVILEKRSHLSRFRLRGSYAAAAIGLTLLFVWFTYLPVWHTDVWGHLRFGEYMVTHGQLPQHEMFSGDFADQESRYINYQWLAQGGAYLLFDLGRRLAGPDEDARLAAGALMLSITHGLILTLRFLLLLWAFTRQTGSLSWALIGAAMVFLTSVFNHLWILRPQILGELGFAALLVALSRPVLSRRALVLVPVVFVLWANCHGSFPVGFILLGVVLTGQVLDAAFGALRAAPRNFGAAFRAAWTDLHARRLFAVILLSIAAICLLNPHHHMLFVHSFLLQSNPNIPSMDEWNPIPVRHPSTYMFLTTVAILILLLRRSPARLTATQVLLLLTFGLQSLAHVRFLVWWSMVFPWVVLLHLQAVHARYFQGKVREMAPGWGWTAATALAVPLLLLFSQPGLWLFFHTPPDWHHCLTAETPVAASRILKKEFAEDTAGQLGRCVFTSETMGEFLLWDLRLEPPVRVFCYTHVHLFTEEHWRECLAVKAGDPDWQDILERRGVDFIVLEWYRYAAHEGGYSDLIEQIQAVPDRWKVITKEPVFVARRIGQSAHLR